MPFNDELLSRLRRRSPLVVFYWQIAAWIKQLPEPDPKTDIALSVELPNSSRASPPASNLMSEYAFIY
jgi:hypothetical protein